MKEKVLVIGVMLFFVLAASWCLHEAREYKRAKEWFSGLYNDWDLFEADYTEDIRNIDRLRNDLEWHKEIRDEWERIAMEFKEEAVEYKMKYKEQYTINNIGLLSKGAQNDSND
ncbi:hypothetical protein LCGC14_2949540 [marine sediment metagenome]|uniref:Uncharacterized protein n=1 Tax=marine sediment metagenome TaxID=412755 RepID=A0A0F8Y2X3_9ZZZZ